MKQTDLKHPALMYAKAVMFILIGITSFALVLAETPSLRNTVLLLLMIWSFSRAYYFAFYVIEKYIDSSYKFSGLFSVVTYLFNKKDSE